MANRIHQVYGMWNECFQNKKFSLLAEIFPPVFLALLRIFFLLMSFIILIVLKFYVESY